MQKSPLQIARQSYQPKMPVALQGAARKHSRLQTKRRFRNSSRTRTVCRLLPWSPQQARTNVQNRLTSA